MAGTKRSKIEIELIVNQLCILLIAGVTRRVEIMQHIARMDALPPEERKARNWVKVGKGQRMLDEYVAKARKLIVENSKDNVENVRALYIAQLEDLYKEARNRGNLRTANSIMKNKLYLQGLGGVNVNGLINIANYDVPLTPKAEKAFNEKLVDFFGEDTMSMLIDDKGGEDE
jgi:hypothetical protein